MASAKAEQIEFDHTDWARVVDRATELAAARRGWINLYPEVEDEHGLAQPGGPVVGLGAIFRAKGPTVPMATWLMATDKAPGTVGLEHGLRSKVLPRLREHGIEPPPGSFRLQDNSRRGLVIRLPADVEPAAVLAWLMEAVDDLCPLQLTGQWLAEVYEG